MARKTLKEIYSERVEAGAAFLNVVHPGWFKKIDVEILDLGDACKCVLGELYGGYGDGRDELGLADSSYTEGSGQAWIKGNGKVAKTEVLGFYIDDDEVDHYSILTKLWVAKIKKLLKKR